MQNWVVRLSSHLPVSQVGRKAAALSRLIDAGFPVPPGVCITTDAFHAAAGACTSPEDLRLPNGLLDALVQALAADERMAANVPLAVDAPLAVRSSSVLEDMPDASLAGRYATYLNVTGPAALERAVLDCWRSFWVESAGASSENDMAVLVQPLLDAECAGVCFSVDPVRQRPDLMMVVSGWGLGAGVVGGSVPTDAARLRRIDLGIEDFSTADKHTALHPAPSGGGLLPASVPADLRTVPCLPEIWLQRVGQFGLAIEQVFGSPQDVEWAIADGQLWILQSRPITTLTVEVRDAVHFQAEWANERESSHLWWLEHVNDRPGAVLLPAEIDFVRMRTVGGQDAVYYSGSAQTRWRKYRNGRVYIAAAESGLNPGVVRVYGAANRDLTERLALQDITLWEHWGPEIERATARLAAFDARAADGKALADHLEDALAAAVRHWMVHTLVPRQVRSAALLDITARMTGKPPAAADIPFLLAGAETVQTRLVEALYDLARLALEEPEYAKKIVLEGAGMMNRAEEQSEAGSSSNTPWAAQFARAFDRLLAVYGGRICLRPVAGFPVDLPLPWREVPEHIWEMIAAYMPFASAEGRPGPREARQSAAQSADARVEALCAAAADSALVDTFRRRLAYARRNAAFTDEHNHYIDQLAEGEYAQALLYAGRWLVREGRLESAFDVFWLNAGEVLDALREAPAGLDEVIAARREEFAGWQARIPPACLGLPDAGLPGRPENLTDAPVSEPFIADDRPVKQANALRGEPASRGRAEGRARIIHDSAVLPELAPGDVVVATTSGMLWTPILPVASALVFDYGSPGDHAAITAREFGLPAVCATLYATKRIPEGAWVTVDGHSGLVTWV